MQLKVPLAALQRGAAQGGFRRILPGLAGAAGILALAGLVLACDTPVYRYAMYRWPPAPYHVLYFHRGSPDAKDGEVNRLLDEAGAKAVPANVAFELIDVSQDETLKLLPEEVRSVWQAHSEEALPRHVVMAPRMGELWSGRLDAAEVNRLLESPLRKKIAQLLHDGHAAVLVLVPGGDAQATRKAEQSLNQAIAQISAGRPATVSNIPAAPGQPTSPGAEGSESPGGAGVAPHAGQGHSAGPGFDPSGLGEATKPLRLALVKLDRKDPQEQWLLRNLLAMQKIPAEKETEPLLYAVFGRGRAMGPCIAEQINGDSIDELVAFLGGACSCVIKDQNPGVDLLFTWDWEATAEHLAQNEEPAAGVGPDYAEIPADMPPGLPDDLQQPVAQACCPAPQPGPTAVAGSTGPASVKGPGADSAGSGGLASTQSQDAGGSTTLASTAASGGPEGTASARQAAGFATDAVPATPFLAAEPAEQSFVSRQLWQLGLGLGALATAILLAGVWVLRRARDDSP